MRKELCFAAGAAAILLAAMPAAAQRARLAASSGRTSIYNRAGASGRAGLVGGAPCLRQSGPCIANRLDRRRGDGRGLGWIGFGYGGLTEDPESLRDQGFFAGTADSWAENGEAVYDYDRGYPYDWYRGSAPTAADAGPRLGSAPPMSCEISWVPGAKGRRSAVRVCRGNR